MVSAILLAAGEARRFGEPKLLLPLSEKTVLECSVETLLNSPVAEVIVVLGHKAEEIAKKVDLSRAKVIVNPDYQQGMSSSLKKGLSAVNKKATGVLIALADQPLVEEKVLQDLIAAFRRQEKGILIPTYRGERGHPVLFSIKYKEELLQLEGDKGGREIINHHPEDVLEVEVDSPSILLDIDTREDYRELIKRKPQGE